MRCIAARYRPFRELIEANMRHYGALRVDHVMSLFRQWWVPAGARRCRKEATSHYPLDDLMSVLALESQRNRCLVDRRGPRHGAGRSACARWRDFGVYHYKVLLFEKESDGRFRAPDALRTHARSRRRRRMTCRRCAAAGKVPTWRCATGCSSIPTRSTRRRVHAERALDRERLLEALADIGSGAAPSERLDGTFSPALAADIQCYLAYSATALVVLQLEDLLGMDEPVNVPGTLAEYPNWQRKLTVPSGRALQRRRVIDLLGRIRQLRPPASPARHLIRISGGSSGRPMRAARRRRRPGRPWFGPRSARSCHARPAESGGSHRCSPYRRQAV